MEKEKIKKVWVWIKNFMFVLVLPVTIVALIIVAIYGLRVFFDWLSIMPDSVDKKDILQIVGAAFAGLAVILNAIFLHRRAKAMDKTAVAQHKTADAHVKENKQSLFNTAIKHLGDDSESVRLGGIYALYDLACEDEEAYKNSVHEILCSHIRSKTTEEGYKEKYSAHPPTEIEALLTMLTNEEKCTVAFDGLKVDLRRAYLQSAKLHDANLQGADLSDTNLQGAYLKDANLQSVLLGNANLQGADLDNANLQGADLGDANLQGADLGDANLQSADLFHANLQGAKLSDANLQGATLGAANLQGANLSNAKLQGTTLGNANLQGANLNNAKLQGTTLGNANLQGANLGNAKLQGANLSNAKLQGANLSNAKLQGADLSAANLQGVYSNEEGHHVWFRDNFETKINSRVGEKAEVETVVLGGITEEQLNAIEQEMDLGADHWDKYNKISLERTLTNLKENHLGKDRMMGNSEDVRKRYLGNSDMGSYTEEELAEWVDWVDVYQEVIEAMKKKD